MHLLKTLPLSGKIALSIVGCLLVLSVTVLSLYQAALSSYADTQAQRRQESSLRVAWDVLGQYGGDFRIQDGQLRDGQRPLNGFFEPVDRVTRLVGGTATIFQGDLRVATNVKKPDGTRAIGTRLAHGPVYDAVLVRGEPYRGKADILGKPYYTAYDPIKTGAGEVIGVLYVGVPQSEFRAAIGGVQTQAMVSCGLATLLIGAVMLWAMRRMFRPLGRLGAAMEALAAGDLSTAAPFQKRADDLGVMARALEAFRQTALGKQRSDAAAEEARAAADQARRRTANETAAAAAEQAAIVSELARGLERLAAGDLTHRFETPFPAGYESLRTDFNTVIDALEEAFGAVALVAGSIDAGARDIAQASEDLSHRSDHQSASLQETVGALSGISAAVGGNADQAGRVSTIMEDAKDAAAVSSEVVGRAVGAMGAIETSADQIGQVIGMIDEIAFQTNLLALNAGVEAARAGDSGRGFAVVAQEVRALAQRSAEAAKEIKALVGRSRTEVSQGVALVRDTGGALSGIADKVAAISGLAAEIAASAREQSTRLGEINVAAARMDQMTRENAAMVQASAVAGHALRQEALVLKQLVDRFTTGRGPVRGAVQRRSAA